MKKTSVIGAGTMGSGIAQVFLQAGLDTALIDRSEEQLEEAEQNIRKGLEKFREKGNLDEDLEEVMGRLETSTDTDAVEGADLVLEAVPEKVEIKRKVYQEAGKYNKSAIYATNTSSIPIKKLAKYAPDPEKFIGMHFFNPAPIMDIVEVVKTENTSRETEKRVLELVEEIGKDHSLVKDSPGFVSNRILMPLINEAVKALDEGVASKEDIDKIAEKGLNHPMGPLKLADFIGLDVCLDIMERIYEESGEARFEPAELLKDKVKNGKLGKKSEKGFYSY